MTVVIGSSKQSVPICVHNAGKPWPESLKVSSEPNTSQVMLSSLGFGWRAKTGDGIQVELLPRRGTAKMIVAAVS